MKINYCCIVGALFVLAFFDHASFGRAHSSSQSSQSRSSRSVLQKMPPQGVDPISLSNLTGTWVGTCQQYSAWDNNTETAYCLKYSMNALKYNFTITYDANGSVSYYMAAAHGATKEMNMTTEYSHPPRYALPGNINITSVAQYKSTSSVCMTWSNMDMNSTQVLVSVTDGVYMQVGAYGVPSDAWIDTKDCYPSITSTTKLYCNPGGPKAYNYICLAQQVM
ncbi:hypothetical protein CEUSTIGMA_g10226.t1 [Chlamydomonas eustigma]|uniref:Lipocalin/cytosolic fatty-acid binding domain-containing protein n=1 Tax=Chlamydomonas eustigma TaxID=1157962 RepID=A0A250XJ24_9CHLO|nr:hypothetical protein CEUSTIGMA_g10226.t1 [Chlamydomonas eustigma]|eukprot:GAX82800.1 hypothetical protein CEUSTIGMA_g10226.t1 [Chlamydomonas eustigma]